MEILLQLHGGGGGSSHTIKQSAPGSTQAATIDSASEDERASLREKLASKKGKGFTDKTGGSSLVDTVKKALLGE